MSAAGRIRSVRRGTCQICHRQFGLLKDGRVGRHGTKAKNVWPPEFCPGWGQLAVEAEA